MHYETQKVRNKSCCHLSYSEIANIQNCTFLKEFTNCMGLGWAFHSFMCEWVVLCLKY